MTIELKRKLLKNENQSALYAATVNVCYKLQRTCHSITVDRMAEPLQTYEVTENLGLHIWLGALGIWEKGYMQIDSKLV